VIKKYIIRFIRAICLLPAGFLYLFGPILTLLGIGYRFIYSTYISLLLKNHSFDIKVYPHIKICGAGNITVGGGITIDRGTTLYAVNRTGKRPSLKIGSGANIGESNHITCCNSIEIGKYVLTGKHVTITDNSHGDTSGSDLPAAPYDRPIRSKGTVNIGDKVWIGDKVTILPGVNIGEGAIIGANSVVTHDIPAFTLACGNPAVGIKTMNYD